MENLTTDITHALRSLARRPRYTAAATLTLALGIGASTVVYAAIDAMLVDPLPFEELDGLVMVWGTNEQFGQLRDVVSGPNFADLAAESHTVRTMAAFEVEDLIVATDGVARLVPGIAVTGDFFAALRARLPLGRGFTADDERGDGRGVVISHAVWQGDFGGDPEVVGRPLATTVHGTLRVVGVLPASFRFVLPVDAITLLRTDTLRAADRTSYHYWVLGRLEPGVPSDRADAELDGLMRDLASRDPRLATWSVTVEPLAEALASTVRPALMLLFGSVALLTFIACANVAGLVATERRRRRRDIALRAALGATRGRLVRQLIAESGVLAILAGGLGLMGAAAAITVLPGVVPSSVGVAGSAAQLLLPPLRLEPSVILAATLTTGLTILAVSVVPALSTAGFGDLALRNVSARRGSTAGGVALLVPLALAVTLLAVAGQTVSSAARLLGTDAGFDTDGVLTLYTGELVDATDEQRVQYFESVVDSVRAVPGVQTVGLNDYVPLQREDDFKGFYREDRPRPQPGTAPRVEWRRVNADYFEAAGITLVRGRRFTDDDDARTASVAVVNRAMAERFWPGENPVGKRIRLSEGVYGSTEVVGIVETVRRRGLGEAGPPVVYVPFQRRPRTNMALFVRADGDPALVREGVLAAVRSVDPLQPIDRVLPLAQVVRDSLAVPRLAAAVLTALAVAALGLAAIGIVAVVAFHVQATWREMGIRLALGETPTRLRAGILVRTLWIAAAAAGVGCAVAYLSIRVAAARWQDMITGSAGPYAIAAALVLAASACAAYAPARRVTRLDPADTLRTD